MKKNVLREIHGIFEVEERVVAAYLFGSTATGKTGKLSDVDIAILTLEDYKPTLEFQLYLMNELSSIFRKDVDVVMLNEASPLLRYEVIKHGKLLYCRDELARVAFEERTLDEYLDMNRIEKEYFKCLLQSVK